MGNTKKAALLVQPRQRFCREDILALLRARVSQKEPILMAGAGIGIVAKMGEAAGIDLLTATSEDRLRMMGQPSCLSYMAVGNANDMALDALRRCARMARHTPVLCGLAPGDPQREPEALLAQAQALGADGMIGLPNGDGFGPCLDADVAGSVLHSEADLALLRLCREREIFSAAVCYDAEYAQAAAQAGADLIVAHAGYTCGGLIGPKRETVRSLEETIAFTDRVVRAVWSADPRIPVLCHGAALTDPRSVQLCLKETGAQGFFGGSVFDRLPIEQAVTDVVGRLKGLQLRGGSRK